MDKAAFVQKVKMLCLQKGVKPTNACKECGVGGSFLSDIGSRGQSPSVERVQMLAAYLGVTTSELLDEEPPAAKDAPTGQAELDHIYRSLNQEGQEKLLGYAKDLEDTGRYIKSHPDCLGEEKNA